MNLSNHSNEVINKMRSALWIAAAVTLLTLLVGVTPSPASDSLTVGEFAVILAGRVSDADSPQAALSPEAASEALESAGIRLRDDLSSAATEEDAVTAFRQLGITLQAENPRAALDRSQVESLVSIFGSSLASKAAAVAPPVLKDPRIGAQDAVPSSAPALESIADCQALPKTQDCMQCCRDLLPPGQNDSHSNRTCGKACNSKARSVSASEPTP